MCFKKPKLPPKTPEQIATEKELEEAKIARKVQLERDLATEKEAATESALARALGFVGNRSLIAGPKGGAGYIGAGARGMRGRKRVRGGPAPISLLPPSQSPTPIASGGRSGGSYGGGSSGGDGGGAFSGGGFSTGNVER